MPFFRRDRMEAASACVDKDRLTVAKFAISGKKNKIEVLPCATSLPSEFSGTFCIWEEDHTLGNVLRHYIMKKYRRTLYVLYKNPFLIFVSENVEFCGYTIPHPSEFKIHLRIQTNRMSIVLFRLLPFFSYCPL